MTRKTLLFASMALVVSVLACEPPARDLGTLVTTATPDSAVATQDLGSLTVADSLYRDAATGEPWSGPVYRPFAEDSTRVQIQGTLLDGTWDGEFRVFHLNGRIRYEGSFANGERCGPWTENADSVSLGSVYEELERMVESMGIYPPCG